MTAASTPGGAAVNRRPTLVLVLAAGLAVCAGVARADDVCSGSERAAANAQLEKARAAQAAGRLEEALRLASGGDGCADDTAGQRRVVVDASYGLGQAAEQAGRLEAAFDHYQEGLWAERYEDSKSRDLLGNARRVALAMVSEQPGNRELARRALEFMNRENQSDGVTKLVAHMDAQARALLAEEERLFSIEKPHRELLEQAEDWLQAQVLTGVPESGAGVAAEIKARWAARGDQFAALDHHAALSQALDCYDSAGLADKADGVRAKARRLADGLAGGENWAEAERLYRLAGDDDKAQALESEREASAATTEVERKQKFDREQADLEKELGF